MKYISLILLLVSGVISEDLQLPDGRLFNLPNPENYSYILKDESPSSLERLYVLSNKAYMPLLCPKGYSIVEMTQEIVVNQSFSHLISNDTQIRHTASLLEDIKPGHHKEPLCPPLYDCLGYQACLFQYGRHFCHQIAIPTVGYSLLLTIGCFRDDNRLVPKKFKKQKDLVLHIYPKHRASPEMMDLSHTELPEKVVFNGSCSDPSNAKQMGYQGTCSEFPPSSESASQDLWPMLGRTFSGNCRDILIQVYCAFQYNKKGLCVPPLYHNMNGKSRALTSNALRKGIHNSKIDLYKKFLSKHNPFLIPARLAFIIMVHTNVQTVKDLIQSIYREEYLYVIHVDKESTSIRKELTDWIVHSNFLMHTISILPKKRSFSWHKTSYESVQAQLEGFKELLTLGPFDFVINLSEDDLPLRNVDDFSMALAPYRGSSFLSSVHLTTENKINQLTNSNGAAFCACDGNSYKVTPKILISNTDEIQLFRSPRGGAFSRDFIEYLVNEQNHSPAIKKFKFYLQTDISPDESYIPTILMNSQFRNSLHLAPILTSFQTDVKESVQEYPVVTKAADIGNDIQELLSLSQTSFFARDIFSLSSPETQTFSLGLAKNTYYEFLESYLPVLVLKVLAEKVIAKLSSVNNLQAQDLVLESILNLNVVPSLVSNDSCCRCNLIESYTQITDFNYWMDISLLNKFNGKYEKVRLMLEPTIRRKICFNDGDLKAMYISQWLTDKKYSQAEEWPNFNFDHILPIPYGPSYSDGITVNLLFTKHEEKWNCTHSANGISKGDPLVFNKKTFLKVSILLISAEEKTKCASNITLFWGAMPRDTTFEKKTSTENLQLDVVLRNVTVQCKNMKPGPWTLQLYELEKENPRLYTLKFYLLDLQYVDNLKEQLNDVGGLWDLKHFAVLSQNASFDFLRYENQEIELFQDLHQTLPEENFGLPDIIQRKKFHQGTGWMNDWLICNRGFASFVTICFTVILLCVWRYRISRHLIMFFLLSLVFVAMLQITLFMTLCVQ